MKNTYPQILTQPDEWVHDVLIPLTRSLVRDHVRESVCNLVEDRTQSQAWNLKLGVL